MPADLQVWQPADALPQEALHHIAIKVRELQKRR